MFWIYYHSIYTYFGIYPTFFFRYFVRCLEFWGFAVSGLGQLDIGGTDFLWNIIATLTLHVSASIQSNKLSGYLTVIPT